LADGIDPIKASVTYRDISQVNFSINNHILKHHAGDELPLIMNQTLTSESLGSASESRVMKYPKTMQSAFTVVRQAQNQSQEQLNLICVVNVVLKMGLPVFMSDTEGFLLWLAMLNPKFQS
jgi:hypothetical protein